MKRVCPVEILYMMKAVRFNSVFYNRCQKIFPIHLFTFDGEEVRTIRFQEAQPAINSADPFYNLTSLEPPKISVYVYGGSCYYIPMENGMKIDTALYNFVYMEISDDVFDIFSDLVEI